MLFWLGDIEWGKVSDLNVHRVSLAGSIWQESRQIKTPLVVHVLPSSHEITLSSLEASPTLAGSVPTV